MSLETLMTQFGLPALFAGGVVEGYGTAMIGGAMAHKALVPYWAAALSVAAGSFLADQVMFLCGRRLSSWPRIAALLASAPAQRVLGLMQRSTTLVILAFPFVYGTSLVTPLSLGAAGVSHGRFLALNLVSVAIWGFVLTGIGMGLGAAVQGMFGHLPLHHHMGIVLGVVVLLLGGLAAWRRRR